MAVYFLEAVGLDLVKIGAAKDPAKRRKMLDTASPTELRFVRVLDIDNSRPGGGRLEGHSLEVQIRRKRNGKPYGRQRFRSGSTSHRVETALHERFASHRVRGEWFKLSAIRNEIMSLDVETLTNVTIASVLCRCGRPLLATNVSGKCKVCEMIGRSFSPDRLCVDCGKKRKVKGVGKLGRCRPCHLAFSTKRSELAKQSASVCASCGGAKSPLVTTPLCRGCAMREAWKDPEYRRRRGESQRAAIEARHKRLLNHEGNQKVADRIAR